MAAIKIGPPTQQGQQTYQRDLAPNLMPSDPRDPTLVPGTTPAQAEVGVSTDVLPSRVTGQVEGDVSEDYDAGGLLNPMNVPGVGDFIRGANDLILAIPDLAVNAVAEGLETAGLVEPNVVDRNYLKRLFNSTDYESQKVVIPYLLHYGTGRFAGQSDQEGSIASIARSAGQATAASLPLIGMQMRAAAAPTIAGSASISTPSTTTTTQRVAETMVAPFRTSPATAAGVETALSAASGAGAQAETELLGTNTGLGGLIPLAPAIPVFAYYGAKAGGKRVIGGAKKFTPAGRAFSWATNTVKGGIDDVKVGTGRMGAAEGEEGQAALGALQGDIAEAASFPKAQENIAKAAEIEATLGGYADAPIALSPAETTMDAPLLATQARIEGQGDAAFTRENNARKTNVLTAAERFIDGELTGSPVDDAPMYVYNMAKGTYEATYNRIDAEGDEITNSWSLVTDADTGVYPKLSDRAAVGENIRTTIVAAQQSAKDEALALAKKLKINDADPVGNRDATAGAQAAVRDALTTKAGKEAISYEGLPPLVRKFVEFKFKDGKMSFQDWKAFRDQVGSAIGVALAKGDNSSVRPLAILSEQLDNMATSYGRTNEKFEQFRLVYDKNVVAPFERSGVIRITSKGPGTTGEQPQYYLPDEQVVKAFLADTNTARQFMTLFADKPADMRAMKAVVLDQIRDASYNYNKGVFNPDKINSYLNKNREVLTELGLFDQLVDTRQLIDDQVARQAALTDRKRAIQGNSLLGAVGRALKNESPDQLFKEALTNPAKMRELKRVASQATDSLTAEQSGQAFRAAITQKMLAKAPDALESPTAFKQWMVKNEEVLDAAFDKSHVDNLYLIADAAERILVTGLSRGKGVSDEDIITRFTGALGTTPAGISNRFIAVQEGRLGSKAMVGYIVSRAIRQQSGVRSDTLFREAMFNPDIAKLLATEGGDSVPPLGASEPNKRKINTYLFNIGVDYGEGVTGEGATQELILEPQIPEQPITETPPPPAPVMPDPKPFPYAPTPGISLPTPKPSRPPAGSTASVGIETLFPNDPTSIAIAKRRTAGQAQTGVV